MIGRFLARIIMACALLGISMAVSGTYALLRANHQRFVAHRELIDISLADEDAAEAQRV